MIDFKKFTKSSAHDNIVIYKYEGTADYVFISEKEREALEYYVYEQYENVTTSFSNILGGSIYIYFYNEDEFTMFRTIVNLHGGNI